MQFTGAPASAQPEDRMMPFPRILMNTGLSELTSEGLVVCDRLLATDLIYHGCLIGTLYIILQRAQPLKPDLSP